MTMDVSPDVVLRSGFVASAAFVHFEIAKSGNRYPDDYGKSTENIHSLQSKLNRNLLFDKVSRLRRIELSSVGQHLAQLFAHIYDLLRSIGF